MRQRSIALEHHPFFPAAAINCRHPKTDGRCYTLSDHDAVEPGISRAASIDVEVKQIAIG